MLFYVILLSVSCVLVLLLRWKKKTKAEYYPEPPTYPGALPFIGHGHLMYGDTVHVCNMLEKFSYYSLKVGGTVKFQLGPDTYYGISDPDDVLTVMNTCLDKARFYDYAKDWIGNGLITADVSIWKNHRKLLNPAFSTRMLNQYLGIFNSQARKLIDLFVAEIGNEKFDPYGYLVQNALETVNETIVGLKNEDSKTIDINYSTEINNLEEILLERVMSFWLYIPFLYNRSDLKKRLDTVISNCKEFITAAIEKHNCKLEYRQKNIQNAEPPKMKTLLDYMMEENITNSNVFTPQSIKDHLGTFILASFETTTIALMYALNFIGAHPKVQEEIYKEIVEVFGGLDRNVEKEDLSKLVYLEAAIKETLRLCPTIPGIARAAPQDVKLKNYTIPGGHSFLIFIHAVHRNPAWGEDVEEFKPERWLGPNRPPTKLFLTFSAGRRNCIGEQYALNMMKIFMVHIMRRYVITADCSNLVHKYASIVKPVSGHEISIKPRF